MSESGGDPSGGIRCRGERQERVEEVPPEGHGVGVRDRGEWRRSLRRNTVSA